MTQPEIPEQDSLQPNLMTRRHFIGLTGAAALALLIGPAGCGEPEHIEPSKVDILDPEEAKADLLSLLESSEDIDPRLIFETTARAYYAVLERDFPELRHLSAANSFRFYGTKGEFFEGVSSMQLAEIRKPFFQDPRNRKSIEDDYMALTNDFDGVVHVNLGAAVPRLTKFADELEENPEVQKKLKGNNIRNTVWSLVAMHELSHSIPGINNMRDVKISTERIDEIVDLPGQIEVTVNGLTVVADQGARSTIFSYFEEGITEIIARHFAIKLGVQYVHFGETGRLGTQLDTMNREAGIEDAEIVRTVFTGNKETYKSILERYGMAYREQIRAELHVEQEDIPLQDYGVYAIMNIRLLGK